jgi:hypothetical protein
VIDSIGELVVGSIEFLAEIIDWGTWFGTRSPRIVSEPAPERTDVDVSVEGNAIEGIVPPAHHGTARAVGYVLQVPSVLLASHCRRISRGGTPTRG